MAILHSEFFFPLGFQVLLKNCWARSFWKEFFPQSPYNFRIYMQTVGLFGTRRCVTALVSNVSLA